MSRDTFHQSRPIVTFRDLTSVAALPTTAGTAYRLSHAKTLFFTNEFPAHDLRRSWRSRRVLEPGTGPAHGAVEVRCYGKEKREASRSILLHAESDRLRPETLRATRPPSNYTRSLRGDSTGAGLEYDEDRCWTCVTHLHTWGDKRTWLGSMAQAQTTMDSHGPHGSLARTAAPLETRAASVVAMTSPAGWRRRPSKSGRCRHRGLA